MWNLVAPTAFFTPGAYFSLKAKNEFQIGY